MTKMILTMMKLDFLSEPGHGDVDHVNKKWTRRSSAAGRKIHLSSSKYVVGVGVGVGVGCV